MLSFVLRQPHHGLNRPHRVANHVHRCLWILTVNVLQHLVEILDRSKIDKRVFLESYDGYWLGFNLIFFISLEFEIFVVLEDYSESFLLKLRHDVVGVFAVVGTIHWTEN